MLRRFFITAILFSFFFQGLNAQSNYSVKDSAGIFRLLTLADELTLKSAYDSAKSLADAALALSQKLKMKRGEAYAHLKIADLLTSLSKKDKILYHDSLALKLAGQIRDSFLIALAYYQIGVYFMNNYEYDEGRINFDKALATKFEKDQSGYTATVYNDIGYLHGLKGALDEQVSWYLKAIDVYEKNRNISGLAQTVSNLSVTYNELGKKKEAIAYAKMAIALREKLADKAALAISYNNLSQMYLGVADSLDQAEKYMKLGVKAAESSGLPSRAAQSYITYALVLNRKGRNQEALEYEKKAIDILENIGAHEMLSKRYIAAGILSKHVRDSLGALNYFQKAHDLAVKINSKDNLRDVYLSKTVFYKDNKDYYNAYENYKKFIAYRDSVVNERINTNIADITTKYETEKKDKEIIRLNADQKITQLEIEKQKAIIAGNLLEAKQKENEIDLLSKTKELQAARINQQAEEIEKQSLLAKNKEQQLKLTEQENELNEKQLANQKTLRNIMIAGVIFLLLFTLILVNRYQLKKKLEQQNELLDIRNNIARDLHDEIGSTLTSIRILSEVSKNNLVKDQEKASVMLQKITEQSSQMQQGMSDIVWAIKPNNDKLENMVIRMREYINHTLESKNIQTSFNVDERVLNQSLSMEQRRDFLLIFKEAVNNAAKYSRGKQVKVDLVGQDGQIELKIADDGVGFDAHRITSSNGLKNMRSRAEALKGNFSVISIPEKGTTVYVKIPTG